VKLEEKEKRDAIPSRDGIPDSKSSILKLAI